MNYNINVKLLKIYKIIEIQELLQNKIIYEK